MDHTKLKPGLYVSRVDWFAVPGKHVSLPVTTFDLRMVPPNSEVYSPLPIAALHTIEHLGTAFLYDSSQWKDRVICFGPLGSRTGCRLVLVGDLKPQQVVNPEFRFTTVRELVVGMCWHIMSYTAKKILDATPEECGNYRDHNLLAARQVMHNYYAILCQTREDLGYDQFTYPK